MSLFGDDDRIRKLIDSFVALKRNVSEWVVSLDARQYEAERRIKELEARQRDVEAYLRGQRWN